MRLMFLFGCVGMAVVELLSSVTGVPWLIGGGFAVAFIALTMWYRRTSSKIAFWALTALLFLEHVPFYERPDATSVVVQLLAAVVALVGLVGAIGLLVNNRRAKRVAAPT